jgi:hypothetical protein
MLELQKVVVVQADSCARSIGSLTKTVADFHSRCVPKHAQRNYDIGIAAVEHRHKRNELIDKENITRSEAEQILKDDSTSDLCVAGLVPKEVTARACRAKTRQITSHLREANRESIGMQESLPEILEVPKSTRDATAEVSMHITCTHTTHTHTRTHTHIHSSLTHTLRRSNI